MIHGLKIYGDYKAYVSRDEYMLKLFDNRTVFKGIV